MNKFTLRQSLILLLTATIWGFAFVAQSVGMDYIGPFTFNATRNFIGVLVLLPNIYFFSNRKIQNREEKYQETKLLLIGGICCGIFLFLGTSFQQFGIQYTSVGKAGFITALYIVIVPLLGIFFHKKVGLNVGIAVAMAVVGFYLLCMKKGEFGIHKGDILVFICAIAFSFHILVVDYFSPKVDGVKLACLQFFVCAILSAIGMFLFEKPQLHQIIAAWKPILYAGALSCGVGYTLQIVGQKGLNPTIASLIMSLESVISLLAGWLMLGQKLSIRELSGCVIVFAAICLAQLPDKRIEKTK